MTATETLLKIIELTNKNLEILGLINESFFTNKEHLTTVVDGTRYTIPSFISLENKVNHLQAAFNNLVHSPLSGEAYMNFDGNSRVIQMRGFQQGPPQVNLDNQTSTDLYKLHRFFIEDSNLFKDMLSPKPYVKLDLSELEDDITQVVVKKIVPYTESLIQLFADAGAGDDAVTAIDYGVMRAILDSGNIFKRGVDYAEYETIYNLPIRKLTCFGEYIVEDIKSDIIDDKLNNIITVQLDERTPTTCTIYDGFTTRNLRAGDILTTYDGSARFEIVGLTQSTRTLELKVLSGEYLNILPNSKSVDDKVSDYSKLRFYKPEDFDSDKYLNIPLEEDAHVYITIAPLNNRMNTQANWGTGLYINVDGLETEDGKNFRDYYKENVKNIGDTINELAAILPKPLTNLNSVEFDSIRAAKPYLTDLDGTTDTLQVVQINKHLNEAENIKTIRNLYSQKQQYKVDLNECQNKIATLTSELSEISFDDMSGSRTMISAQIDDLKARQNELIASINTAVDAIALAANDSEVPIEDSKFRIRGYVDIDRFISRNGLEDYADNVRAVKIRYRYKNPGISELANVSTIGDFLFTEWNIYSVGPKHKTVSYSAGTYTTEFDEPNMSDNDIKFNQVDIPITQGEQVDIQAKIVWDFGYPFVSIESNWSDAVTITFPQELAADVQVTTIIRENNDDIETYRFENILNNHGITAHSNDYIDDQNIRYFHKPESISSGFYTQERRVIPLADKLKDMNAQLASIQDMLIGTHAESLQVSLNINNIEYILKPDIKNVVQLTAYNAVPIIEQESNEISTGISRGTASAAATTFGSITIKNVTDHTLRLFSMVPGARDQGITSSRRFQNKLNREFDYAEPEKFDWQTPVTMPYDPWGDSYNGGTPRDDDSDDINSNTPAANYSTGPNTSPTTFEITPGELFFSATIGESPKTFDITIHANNATSTYKATSTQNESNFGCGYVSISKSKLVPRPDKTIQETITVSYHPAGYAENLDAYIYLTPEIEGTYVTDVLLVSKKPGHNVGALIATKVGEGWKKINYNLNGGISGGDDIYLLYKTSEDPGHSDIPITGFIFRSNPKGDSTHEKTMTWNSRTWNLAPIDPDSNADFISSDGDLNRGARGNYIYLYYTREFEKGNPQVVEKITIDTQSGNAVGNISDPNSAQDLNAGGGGDYIYMHQTMKPLNTETVSIPVSCITSYPAYPEAGNTLISNNNYYIVGLSDYVDYGGGKMTYIMDPSKIDFINGISRADHDDVLKEQPCNLFATFRIKEPYANNSLGDQTLINENVYNANGDVVRVNKVARGVGDLDAQKETIDIIASGQEPPYSFVYATPTASNPYDLCIQSDAVQSVMEIGPGDSKTIPIFVAYFMKPDDPNSSYTLGFDIRNSLYNDPLFYQVTLAARYNQTFEDLLQSQKASVNNQTNYNPVIRS